MSSRLARGFQLWLSVIMLPRQPSKSPKTWEKERKKEIERVKKEGEKEARQREKEEV